MLTERIHLTSESNAFFYTYNFLNVLIVFLLIF